MFSSTTTFKFSLILGFNWGSFHSFAPIASVASVGKEITWETFPLVSCEVYPRYPHPIIVEEVGYFHQIIAKCTKDLSQPFKND